MDFSSVPRVLESLERRQPPLECRIVQRAQELRGGGATMDVWMLALEEWLTTTSNNNDNTRWEPLAVGLFLATELLLQQQAAADAAATTTTPTVYMEGPRVPIVHPMRSPSFQLPPLLDDNDQLVLCRRLHTAALQHLEHKEPRVRSLVAKAVAAYAPHTPHLVPELHAQVLASIQTHIATGRDAAAAANSSSSPAAPENNQTDDATSNQTDSPQYSRSSSGALDDTTGWRALETNWQCLASLIAALGGTYFKLFPLTDQLLQDCQYSCITHVNRHVRAAGMAVLEQCVLAAASSNEENHKNDLLISPTSNLRQTITAVLRTGLADNWSQVRMAASVLCRVFFTHLPHDDDNNHHQAILAALVPRMCLNRFYLAQGVKLYSHETWKFLFPDSGLPVVASQLPAVVRYYVQMCDANNHVVREAACQAIAELAIRLGDHDDYRDTLQPHVDVLLQALLMCFHDESWPVRDEACLACATLCKSFPDDCWKEFKTLWERWTEQLTDQIWSVRQDAAVALGDALDAYGDVVWNLVVQDLIPKILPAAREQAAMTRQEYKAHMNDESAHTDSQLYSCGSLAPKLSKKAPGAGRIGCSSCGIDRPKAPWEATDGCIYLLRELCLRCHDVPALADDDAVLLPLLTELADVCRVQHFPQADDLRATLWKQLPVMANALGKQRFKRVYLEVFLDLLMGHLESRSASPLSLHAAGQCADALADLVGRSIFRGRLDLKQQDTFDRVMQERRMEERIMPDDGAFSPYGPPGLLDGIGRFP